MGNVKIYALLIFAFIGLSAGNSPLQFEERRGFRFSGDSNSDPIPRKVPRADSPYRLPLNLRPQSYSLTIRPILEGAQQWTAPGHIDMTVLVNTTTNKIVFHRHQTLQINNATVKITDSANNEVQVETHDYQELYHFHTITLKDYLVSTNTYTISLDFVASVSDTTDGLYRAQYVDDKNVTHLMATTQFEAYSAREAFPCFDEPDLKATFTIRIGRMKKYNSLSNSALDRTENFPGLPDWELDIFKETVKMPTYLIALVVSDYTFEDAPAGIYEKPVRIYGAPYLIKPDGSTVANGGGHYAANASAHILSFLQTKYVHKYEMHKMDSIGIPTNFFSAGAMENWGLNTYRENYLLFFEGQQGWSNKLSIASILSHELAHQWFGNLVTCNWWTQLWLNEGFATYVSFVAVAQLFPEFKQYKDEMLWDSVQYAMAYDVGRNQPVVNSAYSLEELDTIFSTITYDKGGSIIRMMEGFLGEDTLTKGLVKYLQANAYKGAEQDALFEALNEQAKLDNKLPADKTVKGIMDTWTLQSGYPLIRASKISSSRIYISQEIFGAVPNATGFDENLLWEVPIAIANVTTTNKMWLPKTQVLTSYVHDTTKWIFINPDGMGYYRVLYDDELGALLRSELKTRREVISALSRSQLIDDYFNLAKYKYIQIGTALTMSSFIDNAQGIEENHVVWYTLLTSFSKALTMFQSQNSGVRHSLRNYLVPLLEKALAVTGWTQPPTDEGTSVLFRAKLIDWACALESDACFVEAKKHYDAWKPDPTKNPIPVDLQPVIYCAIAAQGGESEFEFLMDRYTEVNVDTNIFNVQRPRLLNALACTKDQTLLNFLLEEILNEKSVLGENRGNIVTILQRIAMNSVGRPLVLNFIDNKFDQIKNLTGGISAFESVVTTLSSYYSSTTDRNSLLSFIEKRKPNVGDSLNKFNATINANIEWVADFYSGMDAWFKNPVV